MPRSNAPPRGPRDERPRASRVPVERLLPESVRTEIRDLVVSSTEPPGALAWTIDQRLDIAERFGVSKRRLRHFVDRLRKSQAQTATPSVDADTPPPPSPDLDFQPTAEYRHRQASVAAILEQTFGCLADCQTQLWEQQAYLMLVGLVYERLATNELEIPTDELVKLAKALADNRRVQARLTYPARANADSKRHPPTDRLPENFADIVRQVYGTNFHDPVVNSETPVVCDTTS